MGHLVRYRVFLFLLSHQLEGLRWEPSKLLTGFQVIGETTLKCVKKSFKVSEDLKLKKNIKEKAYFYHFIDTNNEFLQIIFLID